MLLIWLLYPPDVVNWNMDNAKAIANEITTSSMLMSTTASSALPCHKKRKISSNLNADNTNNVVVIEKETIDGEIKSEEKEFDDNVSPLSSTLIHHSSNSDPAITMIGYRFRYNKKIASREEDWEEKYLALIKYKSMHGNCDVPKRKTALWRWLRCQRNCFRFVWSRVTQYYASNNGWLILTANRVERLNSLGFNFGLSPTKDPTITTAEYKVLYDKAYITQNLQWENSYSALLEYKLKHGQCNVPRRCPLGVWLKLQKCRYAIYHNNPTLITLDQAERLNTLGINWVMGSKSSEWYSQFDALCSYQLKHGNTNVPQSFKENSTLSVWVREQKLKFKKGEMMNTEKINLLNEIYFCWDEQSESLEEEESTLPNLSTWKIRFSELADYKLKHGNCDVPDEYPLNSKLELWVKHQRFLYKVGNHNKHPLFMNSRSYTKLNELGFSWSIESYCIDNLRRYDKKKTKA